MDYPKREALKIYFLSLWKENKKYLKKTVFKPYLKMLCMRMILFYQSVGLVGKSLSTLIATTLQHSSSCRRSHSFTESVYFASLSFLGLVGSFHFRFSLFVAHFCAVIL